MKHVKHIWALFLLDWKRIVKNPVAFFLILALMVIPSLYAWFNIKALWDPYANTSQLPIAVYSDDAAANFQGISVQIGKEVLAQLHQNKQLGWRFVHSKAELVRGVRSGKYYAGIYLPQDFSKDLLSFTTGEIVKPKIAYYVNEKINAIAPKITEKGASSLQSQISEEFIHTASGSLLQVFNEIGYDLESHLVSLTQVRDLILTTDENMQTLDGYVQQVNVLYNKMPEVRTKLAKANELAAYLPQVDALTQKVLALNQDMPTIKERAKIILTVREKIPEIEQAGNHLAMIDADFSEIEQTMREGIQEAKEGLKILAAVQAALPEIQKLGVQANQFSETLLDAAQKLQAALPSMTQSIEVTLNVLKAVSGDISAVIGQIKQLLAAGNREQMAEALRLLSESLAAQQTGLQQLIDALTSIQQATGDQSLQTEIDQLIRVKAQLALIQQKVDRMDVNASQAEIEHILDEIQVEADRVHAMAVGINVQAISQQVNTLLTQAIQTVSTAKGFINQAQQIDFSVLVNATTNTVTNAIAILEKYHAQLPAIKQEVHDANVLLNGNMPAIIQGIHKGADLYTNELPVVESQLNQAAAFIQQDYPQLKGELTTTLATVNEKMPAIESALQEAHTLLEANWSTLKNGIQQAATAIRKGEQEVDVKEVIRLLKLDAQKESAFFTEPVAVTEHKLYPIANNGSASTPFYTALCLWVGAVLFSSVATTDVYLEKKMRTQYSEREKYVARLGTFLVMGIAQALVVALGNYFLLGVAVAAPFFSVLFAVLIGLAFTALVFMLAALFGNIGKGIAIIILVLSISGGGGNYPIQVSSQFFQRIHPFLPFTYAVDLLRESAGGIYWANARWEILVMVAVLVLSSIIGTVTYPYLEKSMKAVAARTRESHLFH